MSKSPRESPFTWLKSPKLSAALVALSFASPEIVYAQIFPPPLPSDHLILLFNNGSFNLIDMFDPNAAKPTPREVVFASAFPDFLRIKLPNVAGLADARVDFIERSNDGNGTGRGGISDILAMHVDPASKTVNFNLWSEDSNTTIRAFLNNAGVNVAPVRLREPNLFSDLNSNLTRLLFPLGVPAPLSSVLLVSDVANVVGNPFGGGRGGGGPLSNNSDTLTFKLKNAANEDLPDLTNGDIEGNQDGGLNVFNPSVQGNVGGLQSQILTITETKDITHPDQEPPISDAVAMCVGGGALHFSFWSEQPGQTLPQFEKAACPGAQVNPIGDEIHHDPILATFFPVMSFPNGPPPLVDGNGNVIHLVNIAFKSDPVPEPSALLTLGTSVLGLWIGSRVRGLRSLFRAKKRSAGSDPRTQGTRWPYEAA